METKRVSLRVGILTFHCANNFGAVLQTYALCRALKELECEPFVIDYRPKYLVGPYRRLGRRPTTILNTLIRNRRFGEFRKTFIPTTERVYWNANELRLDPPNVDMCVCGSDQIWNLRIQQYLLDDAFFLVFAPERMKRIAYAPSFGDVLSFAVGVDQEIAKRLNAFEAISAREESGQALIRRLVGRDAPIVLDPSLLIGDYSDATKKPQKSPARYLLVYPMESSEEFRCFVQSVRQLVPLPVVNIGTTPMREADFNYNNLGPSEWLGWMQNASFVCTNSFHGTAYSIVFRRDFVSFPHQGAPALNSRIGDLLGQLGLKERFATSLMKPDGQSPYLQPVNYDAMEPLLRMRMMESRRYLKDAIFVESIKALEA